MILLHLFSDLQNDLNDVKDTIKSANDSTTKTNNILDQIDIKSLNKTVRNIKDKTTDSFSLDTLSKLNILCFNFPN